jgi:tetratricopeptide (TPR) repeat protein
MKPILAVCAVLLVSSIGALAAGTAHPASPSAEDVRPLLDKAIDELVTLGYLGDTSAAERYLAAVLEQQPENLEARWQLLSVQLMPLKNVPLSDRTTALAQLSPEFDRLARIARASKQEAFLHYMTAIHASFYKNYERALAEIDKAVALDGRSVRYLTAKGRLLDERGKWNGSDPDIEAGIDILKAARERLASQPSPFVRDADYEFFLAVALQDMTKPRWPEVVDHYQRFIAASPESLRQAFAWNNTSGAYQRMGECAKAKEAAEKALAISKFGMAEQNRKRSEFCLEMQKLGVTAPQEVASAQK